MAMLRGRDMQVGPLFKNTVSFSKIRSSIWILISGKYYPLLSPYTLDRADYSLLCILQENGETSQEELIYQRLMLALPVQYNLHNQHVSGAELELP